MKLPTVEFLNSVEHYFSVSYPMQYKLFCSQNHTFTPTKGQFITDIETLKTINRKIGEDQWGDFELAIAGKRHPKDGNKFWGELLPFYFHESLIYGFPIDGKDSGSIHVWSVHTIVHSYPSLSAFMEAEFHV